MGHNFNVNFCTTFRLGKIGSHGDGVVEMAVTCDNEFLLSICGLEESLKIWDIDQFADQVPVHTASTIKKARKNGIRSEENGFFDDLINDDKNGNSHSDSEQSARDNGSDVIESDSD